MSISNESESANLFSQENSSISLEVLIAFLRTGRMLDHASSVLFIVTAVVAITSNSLLCMVGLLLSFMLALTEKYYAWRVALDAELFKTIKKVPLKTESFDQSLAAFLKSSPRAERTMTSRWEGAKRLFVHQSIWLGLQVFSSVCEIAIRIWEISSMR
ncbi:MAG: hypothetical protein V4525_04330 [Pseudomonadota bacterium]